MPCLPTVRDGLTRRFRWTVGSGLPRDSSICELSRGNLASAPPLSLQLFSSQVKEEVLPDLSRSSFSGEHTKLASGSNGEQPSHPDVCFLFLLPLSRQQENMTAPMLLLTELTTSRGAFWFFSPSKPTYEDHTKKQKSTYNTRYSLVVTDPTTNPALTGLSMGERTGSRVLQWVWSYVPEKRHKTTYIGDGGGTVMASVVAIHSNGVLGGRPVMPIQCAYFEMENLPGPENPAMRELGLSW
ncbi:PA domain-containing protein [Colletotrichum higginsianum IMI 349063]|uniref:PA domain-containing protein n=1 Tax=Colletotrichum higginsianum (strain IMI 349063) TaxID=759273 RepID=A0A1B7Y9W9_COLHI|nr:PA domain-containing protein [Colletotrichum higginsianum IMI 349063]OBR08883.1 PA domain-containing protein [Colletotrichum higginsianum IMI 349063]